jgi:multiple sugar transport system substrate-binding protein
MGSNSRQSGRSPSDGSEAIPLLDTRIPLYADLTRRDLLKYAGYGSVAAFLAACGTGSQSGGQSGQSVATAKGGQLTIGSNQSDPAPKAGMETINAAFTKANGSTAVTMNTVDHGTFQDQVSSYLQGTPEDVFTWFSGHRMRFFAAKGLATPIDDVWDKVKGNFSDAFAVAVKGNDGHVYGIPYDYYPWGVFYRKSVFQAGNYKIPTTWDEFKTLCAQMQKDGLVPIQMADKDGWPAQGWFDILNLRLNGYDFHVELLTGKQKFTDPRVTKVFNTWAEVAPFFNQDFAGLTWQQATTNLLVAKKAGMYLIGLFVSQQFIPAGQDALNDLDFFPFPKLGTKYDSENAIDAPIDVFMVSKRSPTLSKDLGQAKAYMEFWAKGATQLSWAKAQAYGFLATANDTDTSSYPALTQKAVQVIKDAKRITQYFDRDSRPDFAGPNGMQSFLLSFLKNPKGDIHGLQGTMQQFWDSLPPEA